MTVNHNCVWWQFSNLDSPKCSIRFVASAYNSSLYFQWMKVFRMIWIIPWADNYHINNYRVTILLYWKYTLIKYRYISKNLLYVCISLNIQLYYVCITKLSWTLNKFFRKRKRKLFLLGLHKALLNYPFGRLSLTLGLVYCYIVSLC